MMKTVSSRIISSSIAWLSASRTVCFAPHAGLSACDTIEIPDDTHHHRDAFVGAGGPPLALGEQEPGRAPGDGGRCGGEESIPGDEPRGGGEGGGAGAECAGDAACNRGSHCGFCGGGGGGGGGGRDLWIATRRRPPTVHRLSDPRAPFRRSPICFPPLFPFYPASTRHSPATRQHSYVRHTMRRIAPVLLRPLAARAYAAKPLDIDHVQDPGFEDVVGELTRRRRKADAKRRQYVSRVYLARPPLTTPQGSSFVDHAIVTVRGGKGGNGAAALEASLRGPSFPSGGNGAHGGSVYITTSPELTSLATVKKRLIAGAGGSGGGAFKHGRKGEDLVVQVPVGTIVRELKREGEEERMEREEDDLGLSDAEKKKKRWQRWFIAHPSTKGEVSEEEYADGEDLLRRERRWIAHTPSFDQTPPFHLDISEPLDEPVLIASGGSGGLGNPFFPSPRLASRGTLPPTHTFEFELKLLADVGLVGFPNAGKSTILRALTGRRAEVAGYQFTTLNPQIGVVRVYEDGSWGVGKEEVVETWIEREREDFSRQTGGPFPASRIKNGREDKMERLRFTLSDNPGLLPMASQNVGLGHSFLRSIERSPVLAYVLDLTKPSPVQDLQVLKTELEAYKPGLSERAGVVVLNKGDAVPEEEGKKRVEEVTAFVSEHKSGQVIVLSGRYGLGMETLVALLADNVEKARIERAEMLDRERKAVKEEPVSHRVSGFGLKK